MYTYCRKTWFFALCQWSVIFESTAFTTALYVLAVYGIVDKLIMPVDFLLGGLAACGAGFFTNPLEVAKTRMQLQGELIARGHYTVHYRNVLHAFYQIGRVDGLRALQKGLVPALWYQFVMNGVRLGTYQQFVDYGLTKDANGRVSMWRSAIAAALCGSLGAAVGSPLYMIKTHLQARANQAIAVGHQHQHDNGMYAALRSIFSKYGIRGLWRGVSGAVPRVTVGSGTQLATYSWTKDRLSRFDVLAKHGWLQALAASTLSGAVVVLFMTPFDVVSTRLYNQGTDVSGRGVLYRGVTDCFFQIYRTEGLWGFYKGWGASLFRLGPHTVLSLMFWHNLQVGFKNLEGRVDS